MKEEINKKIYYIAWYYGFEFDAYRKFFLENFDCITNDFENFKKSVILYVNSLSINYILNIDDEFFENLSVNAKKKSYSKVLNYHYKGLTLKKFCEISNISYSNVKKSIDHVGLNCQPVVVDKIVFKCLLKNIIKNFSFDGILLPIILKKYSINLSFLIDKIYEKVNVVDESINDVINDVLIEILPLKKESSSLFTYKGENAIEFCLKNGLDKFLVYQYYRSEKYNKHKTKVRNVGKSDNQLFEEAIDKCLLNNNKKIYFYNSVNLVDYCYEFGLDYIFIYNRFERLNKNFLNSDILLESIINEAIFLKNIEGYVYNMSLTIKNIANINSVSETSINSAIASLINSGYNKIEALFIYLNKKNFDYKNLFSYSLNNDSLNSLDTDSLKKIQSLGYNDEVSKKILYLFGEAKCSKLFFTNDSFLKFSLCLNNVSNQYYNNVFDFYLLSKINLVNSLQLFYSIKSYVCAYLSYNQKKFSNNYIDEMSFYIKNFLNDIIITSEYDLISLIDLHLDAYCNYISDLKNSETKKVTK